MCQVYDTWPTYLCCGSKFSVVWKCLNLFNVYFFCLSFTIIIWDKGKQKLKPKQNLKHNIYLNHNKDVYLSQVYDTWPPYLCCGSKFSVVWKCLNLFNVYFFCLSFIIIIWDKGKQKLKPKQNLKHNIYLNHNKVMPVNITSWEKP